MKRFRTMSVLFLALLLAFTMTGCGKTGAAADAGAETKTETQSSENAAEAGGVNLKDLLKELYTSEDALGLAGKYSFCSEIPDTEIDPALLGTWKLADGSLAYTYNEDGTSVASLELYGDNQNTFTESWS